jgi:hypothetical protein
MNSAPKMTCIRLDIPPIATTSLLPFGPNSQFIVTDTPSRTSTLILLILIFIHTAHSHISIPNSARPSDRRISRPVCKQEVNLLEREICRLRIEEVDYL